MDGKGGGDNRIIPYLLDLKCLNQAARLKSLGGKKIEFSSRRTTAWWNTLYILICDDLETLHKVIFFPLVFTFVIRFNNIKAWWTDEC